MIENDGNNKYTKSWQGKVETYHAYIHASTNDINGNGKPEFWVLGDAFYDGVAKTRITIFESDGDNSYTAVGKIDIVGIFSFSAGNMQPLDVDKDGKDEMLICIDQTLLILKFNGISGKQTYSVFYLKQAEKYLDGHYITYYGSIMHDLDNDKKEELNICMTETITDVTERLRYVTLIYKPNFISDVTDEDNLLPADFDLSQNYPNPFNPITTIRYSIPCVETPYMASLQHVTIEVYDILGRKVAVLVNEEQKAGKHEVQFNSSELSSGVYIIKMTAGGFQKSVKAVLIK